MFVKYFRRISYFPQLCIIATVLPSEDIGGVGEKGERFIDNVRIEGTIKDMLSEALSFVRKNIRKKTIINPDTGTRNDRTDYPMTAIREVLLNALVHRDYSIHTEGMPIQLQIYPNKIVITNPGGLYGRLSLEQLGKMQADTRNPVLATALETLDITENRYSGIPTIRREMEEYGLPMPKFEEIRGSFVVTLFGESDDRDKDINNARNVLAFCMTPRSRQEIADFLGVKSVPYAIKTYIEPLVVSGKIALSNPMKPKSPAQRYTTVKS